MILTAKHTYKQSHKDYVELDRLCFLSKNLYNATLYRVRQYYFDTGKYFNYCAVNKEFTHSHQVDYRALPAKVSKQTQKLVEQNMLSFFALIKTDNTRARVPRYLDKAKGRQVVHYEKGALSFVKRKGYIHLSKTDVYIPTNLTKEQVSFVRIVPRGNHINIEIGYKVEEKSYNSNKRYAAIDLGMNNLAVLASNVMEPFIINGKPLKSVNQYYNKKLSKLTSNVKKRHDKYTSKAIQELTYKRNNKVNDYMHKSSRYVVNQLVSNEISQLIVGYNKGWKQDITLGKKTNQKFVQIPFKRFIEQLEYKCKLVGIQVVIQEESYTSKTSFIDRESITKQRTYLGKRVKRGLFRTSEGKLINADLNAALNILRKYLDKNAAWNEIIYSDCVEASSVPNLQRITL